MTEKTGTLVVYRDRWQFSRKERRICCYTEPPLPSARFWEGDVTIFVGHELTKAREAGYEIKLQSERDRETGRFPLHPEDEKYIREQLGIAQHD